LPAVAALAGRPEREVEAALESLVDAHLLDSPAPDRYCFHDLLRVYAADRARTDEAEADREAAIRRLLAWYVHTIEAAGGSISPHHTPVAVGPPPPAVAPGRFAGREEALAWCERERRSLVAATRLADSAGLRELAWQLPAAAMSFYFRRRYWADWVVCHKIGLANAEALGDRIAQARMLNNLGIAYGEQRLEGAIDCFERARRAYGEMGDARGESKAAANVANTYLELGRFEEALTAGEESLTIQRDAGNRYGEGLTLSVLGCACRELGRCAAAITYLRRAHGLFAEIGDPLAEADALSDLGEAYLGNGQVAEARDCLRESVAMWEDTGHRHGQANALRRLGRATHEAGDEAATQALLQEALSLFAEIGDDSAVAEIQAMLRGLPARGS